MVALYNYQGSEHGDMTFVKGDVMEIVDDTDPGAKSGMISLILIVNFYGLLNMQTLTDWLMNLLQTGGWPRT